MENIFRIAKKSAKRTFFILRDKGPLFCKSLNSDVRVTRKFLNHIMTYHHRSYKEVVERILIIAFVTDIIEEGRVLSSRHQEDMAYYEISKQYGQDVFCVIIVRQENRDYLLSCFRKYK